MRRLKRCLAKYAALREEAVELREAHDAERRELEALQAALIAELRRRLLVADSFVPDAGRPTVLRLRYNDDADAWEPPEHGGAEPLAARPRAAPGRRRPQCAAALAAALPRHRADDLLRLSPLPLPATTRPAPAQRPPAPVSMPAPPPPPPRPALTRRVSQAPEAARQPEGARRPTARPRPGTAHQRLGSAAAGR